MGNIIKIPVGLGERSYDIFVGGMLDRAAVYLAPLVNGRKCLLLTDSNVGPAYAGEALKILAEAGAETFIHTFPAGEANKTLETVGAICSHAVKCGLDRSSLIVALGGGVCGDIAGFAASIYMRGINFIQIPTTLLAAVDSSVGGKTGVDIPEGKNLIGAFWQPKLVLIDPAMLSTLPPKEIRCGLAEVVKYGVILDPELFAKLEQNIQKLNAPDLQFYPEIIARCCELKAQVVAADERESGLRGILNYGHTFGHAVELNSNFTIAHGEGVAIGMNMAAELAVQSGLLDRAAADRQRGLLKKLSLPCHLHSGCDPEKIYAGMLKDKKKVGSRLNLVIPLAIGKVEIKSGFEPAAIINAIRCCCD
ncbi:MAG: 3-dehydroquinate synthase [Victivallaceae bacterium]